MPDDRDVLQRVQEDKKIEINQYSTTDRMIVYFILIVVLLNLVLLLLNGIGVFA